MSLKLFSQVDEKFNSNIQTHLFIPVCLIFCLFLCSPAMAQHTGDSLKVELDAIEVTAIRSSVDSKKIPISLSQVNRSTQQINHESSLSLADISDELPGLWVNDRQNYALGEKLTIRGIGWRAQFGVRGIQVVLNGIPLTVADGQTMINIVDPAFIRSAELVSGPAAAYWGNSSGGVLSLSTKPDYKRKESLRLKSTVGSYGLKKEDAEFYISSSKYQLSGYTSYLTSKGFRDYSAVNMLRSGVTGSVQLTSKSRLNYQAALVYMPKAESPSSLTRQELMDDRTQADAASKAKGAGKEITQGQTGASYNLDTSAGLLTVTGYGIYRDLSNPLPFGIITVNRWVGGLRATLNKNWSNINVKVGTESKLQNDDRTEFENIGSPRRGNITVDQIERVWNQALFATGTYSMGRINILGGIRYDRLRFLSDSTSTKQIDNRTFQSINPSLGLSYQLKNQTIFANISTSFEAPTTTELVNRPDGGNGFNPNLKPERTIGIELGSRGSAFNKKVHYTITAYNLWIEDLLFPYQLENNGPTYYQNQGETNHKGLEGHISWRLDHNLMLSTTANLIQAKFKKAQTLDSLSLKGEKVPGIPKYRLNGKIKWSPGPFLGSISYNYVSNYAVDNLNTAQNNAYNTFDLTLSYQYTFKRSDILIQPFINTNNIFDTDYNSSVVVNGFGGAYYQPAPGRNWRFGVSVNF